jgi:hypothetical protein
MALFQLLLMSMPQGRAFLAQSDSGTAASKSKPNNDENSDASSNEDRS